MLIENPLADATGIRSRPDRRRMVAQAFWGGQRGRSALKSGGRRLPNRASQHRQRVSRGESNRSVFGAEGADSARLFRRVERGHEFRCPGAGNWRPGASYVHAV